MQETPLTELIQQRTKKLENLRSVGIEPYNGDFQPSDSTEEIIQKYGELDKEHLENTNINVSIAGRVILLRDFGKASFAHIQDSRGRIQIYLRKDILGEKFTLIKNLDIGDIIGVKGRLFRTRTNELTVEVNDVVFLSKSLRPLPEKWHGLKDIEARYRQRYVDLIVNPSVKEIFIKRQQIIKYMREFLENEGFLEVETPMMHTIAGGARAKPFKTYHEALDMELYLRIAPELYLKRLLIGGFEKVFEIGKNFRNEGISTKHNPEFTMIEFYVAYKNYHWLMDFTEKLFGYVASKVCGSLQIEYGDYMIDLTPPYKRVSMYDALKEKGVPEEIMKNHNLASQWAKQKGIEIPKDSSLTKILDEIFKEIVEPELIQPTFIIDYPVELSPLAKRKKDDPELVERFELFIAGREIANAFSELNDPIDQKERFLRQLEERLQGDEEAPEMDEDFVRALEVGMPPAAGEGIGIDRLVMILTNTHSIRDVILFPLLRPETK
ncbi:lysine--tRNA ligase [Thermodesulfovibrio thiophilus]|uniref:lysine--tRNA ligase n=1 Tax=Thermodesulfovibrio thiophilus TaxID=340095 RepID=UPI0004108E98|nr:lysine--tRNA ligase [Thermodesulfovibrio thiophilus]